MRTRTNADRIALWMMEQRENGCLATIMLIGDDKSALTQVKSVVKLQAELKDIPGFDAAARKLAFLRRVVEVRPSLRPKIIFPEDKCGPLQIKSDDARMLSAVIREYVENVLRGELVVLDRDHDKGDLILRLRVKDALLAPNGNHRGEIARLTQALLETRQISVSRVRVEIRGSVLSAGQIH